MKQKDNGMTTLEVVIAFAILIIGVGFMLMSNKAYYAFREQRQERQQMIFYAAGEMEAYLEGQNVEYTSPPFDKYEVTRFPPQPTSNPYLEIIQIQVYKKDSPTNPDPVSIYSYRVKTQ
ncbi:MAG: prepilin-type cleavage/methylation domain-containing protein [Peptococcaceae bacterium]|nr:prepilin-type cleavage/methylation domain-containing protein [Peptococcaceae bacterium]